MPCITPRGDPMLLRGTLHGVPPPLRQADLPLRRPLVEHQRRGHMGLPPARTKTVTLTAAEVEEVTAALARYREAKAALDAAAEAGIAALMQRRAARRGRTLP